MVGRAKGELAPTWHVPRAGVNWAPSGNGPLRGFELGGAHGAPWLTTAAPLPARGRPAAAPTGTPLPARPFAAARRSLVRLKRAES